MTPSFKNGVNMMPTQNQSLIKRTRFLFSVGLFFAGIFSFGSLTLVQTNAVQAHAADTSCIPRGRAFFFENCWWQKMKCSHRSRSTSIFKKISCPDLPNLPRPNLSSYKPTTQPFNPRNIFNGIFPSRF